MSREPNPHAAIVLAAGGSRRLGRAKQLLTRGGETLVHRAVRLASLTQPQRLLLVIGAHADEMREAVADLRVEILVNNDWQEGLASSLRMAVNALNESGSALILGCDQPALEQSHLQRLLSGAAVSASGCAATLHGAAPGIPAVASAVVLREAHGLHGDRGLRGALQKLSSDSLYLLEAAELEFDLDTPADLEKAVMGGWID
ncbi:nucleotidyltransferase family protein [Pseudoxanthomonas sacheonensis]|uniref:nucleotidyltransferase family protein n=1 Tax=Pseudoxanthomonas sacheonensis TaxID=443615 RepID=UPI0013D626DD|nr:nucleotidyltransferase family protein [Pseudoxanthomonas sacheonensis]KAF1705943.1 CTP--molybdopterin cytidylyltransferase [Pseudoxanthomonas sacheonensis]